MIEEILVCLQNVADISWYGEGLATEAVGNCLLLPFEGTLWCPLPRF